VDVAGRHLRTAPVAHQAGQREPAADLQDALSRPHRPHRHRGGQVQTRWPDLAEQRPLRGRDAQRRGGAGRVGELLVVEKGSDLQVRGTRDGERLDLDFVTGHGPCLPECGVTNVDRRDATRGGQRRREAIAAAGRQAGGARRERRQCRWRLRRLQLIRLYGPPRSSAFW
jgi:hypothetical protein